MHSVPQQFYCYMSTMLYTLNITCITLNYTRDFKEIRQKINLVLNTEIYYIFH